MPHEVSPRLGAKLGPRIAMLVHQAIIHAHTQLAGLKHKIAMHIFHVISDEISEEVDVTLGPFLKRLHDETPTDHPAYPGIHFMHTASGQLKALAGTGLQISGLLGSISTVMNNELADIVYNIIRANPALLPDPGVITQALATGQVAGDEALAAIGAQGIQYGWAQRMLTLAYSRVDVTTSLELLRRGLIDHDAFLQNTQWAGYLPADGEKLSGLTFGPVSVADAALGVLRGNLSQADGEKIAAENGFDAASFAILIANTGEPPGLMQLLEAYRRGFIDQATLERGILESRYRNEWIPMLEKLRYEPITTADAVDATVQNNLTVDQARQIADQNGLTPGAIDTLIATAGEPLSRTEMEDLYNRGEVTKDQVIQALRESRLKNKYNDLSFALHTKILPVSDLQRAVRYGAMSEADAVASAMKLGYSKDDATSIIEAGIAERIDVARHSIISAAEALYEIGIMSAAELEHEITGLGYPDKQAQFIVQAAEYHREAKLSTSAVNAVRNKYLSHHIDKNTASGLLDKLGLPATGRDYTLSQWDVEIQGYTRVLTEAQIAKAVKLTLITPDDGLARLIAMGYSSDDATLLLSGA